MEAIATIAKGNCARFVYGDIIDSIDQSVDIPTLYQYIRIGIYAQ